MSRNRLMVIIIFSILLAPISYYIYNLFGNSGNGTIPTGFIQYDQPYYIANALEYREMDEVQFMFPLPFSSDYENDRIYFYPQILLFGMILRYTELSPISIFLVFGLIFSILFIRVTVLVIKNYIHISGKYLYLLSILLFYGGGILFIQGFIKSFRFSKDLPLALKESFYFDPGDGWWFLNLGRNLVYPMEVFYHFIFFSAVYFVIKNNVIKALLCAVFLSVCHPLTGALILIIFLCWLISEKFARNDSVRLIHFMIITLSILWMGYYNFILLPSNKEHAALMLQWELNWNVSLKSSLFAYALVIPQVLIRFKNMHSIKEFIRLPFNRFLLSWLFINLFLENHELLITPRQPLHFTRGYSWACLFFIGLPVTTSFLDSVFRIRLKWMRILAFCLFLFVFTSDNISWFILQSYYRGSYISLSGNQKEVLDHLNKVFEKDEILVSQDPDIGYLSSVYTPYRSFLSHESNTPDYKSRSLELAAYFRNGELSEPMKKKKKIFISSNQDGRPPSNVNILFRNQEFMIYRLSQNDEMVE
jgi:hypothetical protein